MADTMVNMPRAVQKVAVMTVAVGSCIDFLANVERTVGAANGKIPREETSGYLGFWKFKRCLPFLEFSGTIPGY